MREESRLLEIMQFLKIKPATAQNYEPCKPVTSRGRS